MFCLIWHFILWNFFLYYDIPIFTMTFHSIPRHSTPYYNVLFNMTFHSILWNSFLYYDIPIFAMTFQSILRHSIPYYKVPSIWHCFLCYDIPFGVQSNCLLNWTVQTYSIVELYKMFVYAIYALALTMSHQDSLGSCILELLVFYTLTCFSFLPLSFILGICFFSVSTQWGFSIFQFRLYGLQACSFSFVFITFFLSFIYSFIYLLPLLGYRDYSLGACILELKNNAIFIGTWLMII